MRNSLNLSVKSKNTISQNKDKKIHVKRQSMPSPDNKILIT